MVNDADGNAYPTRAVFDEVRPPELLAWTETHSGLRARIEFVELAVGPHRSPDPPDPGTAADRARPRRRPGS